MLSQNTFTFYVSDFGASKIYLFSSNWNYLSNNYVSHPTSIISIGDFFYIITDQNGGYLCKTNISFNVLNQYNFTSGESGFYYDLYYDLTANLIYVSDNALSLILVFDLNLILQGSITIPQYKLSTISGYNNAIYVGTFNGTVIILVNKTVAYSFDVCNNNTKITSIVFDQFGFMAISCSDHIYLYYSNGTSANQRMAVLNPKYIGFDSNGYFVVLLDSQINLYF